MSCLICMGGGSKGKVAMSSLNLCVPMCAVKMKSKTSSTRALPRFGHLDIAVDNVGTVGNPGLAADVTTEAWQAIVDTIVLGVLLSKRYEVREVLREGKGSIMNISSAYGKVGGPCISAASTPWEASPGLRRSNSPARALLSIPGSRRRNDCELTLRQPGHLAPT